MVILLISSVLSLNGSDVKQHAPGVRVTGVRVRLLLGDQLPLDGVSSVPTP
jgi:hypothetical protein